MEKTVSIETWQHGKDVGDKMFTSKEFSGIPATAADRLFNRSRLGDKVARKDFLDGITAERIDESVSTCLNACLIGDRINIDEDIMRVFRLCNTDEIKELFEKLGLDMKSNARLILQFLPSLLLDIHSSLFYENDIDNVNDIILERDEKEMEEQYDASSALRIIRGEREVMESMFPCD